VFGTSKHSQAIGKHQQARSPVGKNRHLQGGAARYCEHEKDCLDDQLLGVDFFCRKAFESLSRLFAKQI